MAGQIKVNTAQVAEIASTLENLNNRLSEELTNSHKTVQSLGNTWDGEAAQATITNFDEFSAKYFQKYHDILDSYVKFLRTYVEQGYFQTETVNTNLADAFK